jgi:hypothetical protein
MRTPTQATALVSLALLAGCSNPPTEDRPQIAEMHRFLDFADEGEKARHEVRHAHKVARRAHHEDPAGGADDPIPTDDGAFDAEEEQLYGPPALHGRLVSAEGEGIVYARICIEGSTRCTETDGDGNFRVQGIEDGISEVLLIRPTASPTCWPPWRSPAATPGSCTWRCPVRAPGTPASAPSG